MNLEIIKNEINSLKACNEELERCREYVAEDFVEKTILENTTIINALEKQIPKKATAKITQSGYDIYFDLRCPICGAVVGTFEEGVNEYFSKYCDNCGQALDWSDTE